MDIIVAAKGRRLQVRAPSQPQWTKDRRTRFLDHLAATCNVTRSAAAAGMHVNAARQLKRRDAAFAALWEQALIDGYERIETELMRRALGDAGPDGDLNAIQPDADRAQDVTPFDPELALRVLARRDAAQRAGARRPRFRYKEVPIEEVEKALLRQLAALAKRLPKG